MTAFSRPALSRFLILYAAVYAGFGVQSPYLPSLLESRDLRPEAIAPHARHANRSCVRCGFLAPFRNLKVRRGWQNLFGYRRFGGMEQTRRSYGLSFDD